MSEFDNCKFIAGEVNLPVDINPFGISEERKQKIDDMIHDYRSAFISLGFDTNNKDLIEVLTFLVLELNKTQAALHNLQTKVETNYEMIIRGGL